MALEIEPEEIGHRRRSMHGGAIGHWILAAGDSGDDPPGDITGGLRLHRWKYPK
jgi:hypothetical protein